MVEPQPPAVQRQPETTSPTPPSIDEELTNKDKSLSCQELIDNELLNLSNWKATLHFSDIEGLEDGEKLDIFQCCADKQWSYQTLSGRHLHQVAFDQQKYPPTTEGLKKLTKCLAATATLEGTQLIHRNGPFELNCHRSRRQQKSKPTKKPIKEAPCPTNNYPILSQDPATVQQDAPQIEETDFDEDGVKIGIRVHKYHRDKTSNRLGGQKLQKCTFRSDMQMQNSLQNCGWQG